MIISHLRWVCVNGQHTCIYLDSQYAYGHGFDRWVTLVSEEDMDIRNHTDIRNRALLLSRMLA